MPNAFGLTTRPVSAIGDNAVRILKSAKWGTKVNAIKIPQKQFGPWNLRTMCCVHKQRINTDANSFFHYFEQRNNFKLVHPFIFFKLATKGDAFKKKFIIYTNILHKTATCVDP